MESEKEMVIMYYYTFPNLDDCSDVARCPISKKYILTYLWVIEEHNVSNLLSYIYMYIFFIFIYIFFTGEKDFDVQIINFL